VDAPIETTEPKDGLRVVSKSGKPSSSRFKFLAFDHVSQTSLVACAPLTGRGHQLRVHLQWLNFPIVDDVQYGGQTSTDETTIQNAVDAMLAAAESHKIDVYPEHFSKEDCVGAKAICRCCTKGLEGVQKSFTNAQLLGGGHAISLHALKYTIGYKPKQMNLEENSVVMMNNNNNNNVGVECEVDYPSWASVFGPIHVSWLQA